MNKIEQLIEELCPEGVEWKELGEMCNIFIGSFVKKTEHNISYEYPVYNGGIQPTGYFNSFNSNKNSVVLSARGANCGFVNYLTVDFWAGNSCYVIKELSRKVNSKFLFHFLKCNEINLYSLRQTSGIPAINSGPLSKFQIPLPPLPIQQEIVTILDTFTALDASLQAELEVRRKQYEHYRNQLLNFEGKEVEWKTLGEIGKVCMCKRVMKHETKSAGDIPFYKIGTFGKEADAFISKELFEEYVSRFSFPKKGDILISASGTIGRRVIYDAKPAYFQDSNIVWLSNNEKIILNKYLYYVYETIEWPVEGGTIKRLYNDNFKKIKIPIPPLSEQERIVGILDKFDALVTSTSSATGGIPAEIAARRKQYEYYREKLLTFEPLAN